MRLSLLFMPDAFRQRRTINCHHFSFFFCSCFAFFSTLFSHTLRCHATCFGFPLHLFSFFALYLSLFLLFPFRSLARPQGMERADLLKDNGALFAPIGKAMSDVAKKSGAHYRSAQSGSNTCFFHSSFSAFPLPKKQERHYTLLVADILIFLPRFETKHTWKNSVAQSPHLHAYSSL
jgi:hypothetical protein